MPEGTRVNVYLPYTLSQRVDEARNAGTDLNLSASAARGIAAELCKLNSPRAPLDGIEEQHDDQGAEVIGRLDAIEQRIGQLPRQITATFSSDMKRAIAQAAAVLAGVILLMVVGLAVYLRPLSTA